MKTNDAVGTQVEPGRLDELKAAGEAELVMRARFLQDRYPAPCSRWSAVLETWIGQLAEFPGSRNAARELAVTVWSAELDVARALREAMS